MSAAVKFDTLHCSKRLQEAGFTTKQAETQTELWGNEMIENLASKDDLALLSENTKQEFKLVCHEMRQMGSEIRHEMKEMEIGIRSDMKEMGSEIRHEMKLMGSQITIRLTNTLLITLGLLFTLQTLFLKFY